MSTVRETDPLSPEDLRRRLTEAEETLAAIRLGEADAVVVEGPEGQQVYCLESPDEPFRIFVESMQEGALTLSGEGTIVYCNRFLAGLLRCPLDQVRGRSLASFVAPEHQATFRTLLDQALDGVVHKDVRLVDGDGNTVPVQLAFNRLPAEHVRMFGVVVTDLTERERGKRLEIERQTAEEAKAARDQFLAVMSHELRAPLSAILGWAQVLRRREDLPELAQHGLDVIVRNAWAQSHLIEDLLDVSRILAGKLRLDLKPIELSAVIRGAVASVQPSAEARHVVIDTHLPDARISVRGDGDRLQQIVFNLLSNAVKFSREGGTVEVGLEARGDVAEIDVVDSGIGISEQDLPRIFDLFTQTGVEPRSSDGLGLGLAIVKQLTELHHGEVAATSTGAGRGATFTLRLPLLTRVAEVEEPLEQEVPADAASLRGVRVILVEDQQDEREMLIQMLASAGAEVLAASTAAEALQLLESEHADLLISDIALPDADGLELIRRIRASGVSGRDLPAVALTGLVGREDRRQALMAGYQMHVSKPLDQDELHAVVANLAGVEGGGRPADL